MAEEDRTAEEDQRPNGGNQRPFRNGSVVADSMEEAVEPVRKDWIVRSTV